MDIAVAGARVPDIGVDVHYSGAYPDNLVCQRAQVMAVCAPDPRFITLMVDCRAGTCPGALHEDVLFCHVRGPRSWHWPEREG